MLVFFPHMLWAHMVDGAHVVSGALLAIVSNNTTGTCGPKLFRLLLASHTKLARGAWSGSNTFERREAMP